MAKGDNSLFAQVRAECIELLNLDADHLSLSQRTRLDLLCGLRLALDDVLRRLVGGTPQPTDFARLESLSASLLKLLPTSEKHELSPVRPEHDARQAIARMLAQMAEADAIEREREAKARPYGEYAEPHDPEPSPAELESEPEKKQSAGATTNV